MNGGAGRRLGDKNEQRVLEILTAAHAAGELPGWITAVRVATEEEDAQGKDLIVTTDKGEVGLQVKSGRSGYVEFRRRAEHAMIALVMVKKRFTDQGVLKKALGELEEIHGAM